MRTQCPDGHWFTFPGPCPYGPPGDPCGYTPEDIPPPPPARRDVDPVMLEADDDLIPAADLKVVS